MKILVVSDSHHNHKFMYYCMDTIKPDQVIHLGDHYEDAEKLAQDYPHIRVHMVPGNCDSTRGFDAPPLVMCYDIAGVRMFMTHGHLHGVKLDIYHLLADAWEKEARIAMFGHTHDALCYQTEDGMWVLNPGSCRTFDGSVALIEAEDGKISACRILRQADIEVMQGRG